MLQAVANPQDCMFKMAWAQLKGSGEWIGTTAARLVVAVNSHDAKAVAHIFGEVGTILVIGIVLDRFGKGGTSSARAPNRIYSTRELMRRAAEPGPFHNFPESFNQQIFAHGTRTVTRNFFRAARTGLSNDSVMYRLRGSVNGVDGTFEIGTRPSISGKTEVIMHRFFRPDP